MLFVALSWIPKATVQGVMRMQGEGQYAVHMYYKRVSMMLPPCAILLWVQRHYDSRYEPHRWGVLGWTRMLSLTCPLPIHLLLPSPPTPD